MQSRYYLRAVVDGIISYKEKSSIAIQELVSRVARGMMEQQGPILVVAAGITKGDGVLLARREEPELIGGHLKWELPGGKVEFGETPEQALEREIYEELRLRIRPERLIPYLHTNIYEKSGAKKHYAILCYQSSLIGPNDFSLTSQLPSRVAWFHKDEIDYETTLPGTREFVNYLLFASSKEMEEATTCLVRLEPVQKVASLSGIDYIEIHILPYTLALSDALAICIIIKRRNGDGGRLQLPKAIQPYIYKSHKKRVGLTCNLLGKVKATEEFGRIIEGFKSLGYYTTKFQGPSMFLRQIEMTT
jgi:8-oxo-dGTP diphosphatase